MNYKKYVPKNCFVLYDVKVDYKQLIMHNKVERLSRRNTCQKCFFELISKRKREVER